MLLQNHDSDRCKAPTTCSSRPRFQKLRNTFLFINHAQLHMLEFRPPEQSHSLISRRRSPGRMPACSAADSARGLTICQPPAGALPPSCTPVPVYCAARYSRSPFEGLLKAFLNCAGTHTIARRPVKWFHSEICPGCWCSNFLHSEQARRDFCSPRQAAGSLNIGHAECSAWCAQPRTAPACCADTLQHPGDTQDRSASQVDDSLLSRRQLLGLHS